MNRRRKHAPFDGEGPQPFGLRASFAVHKDPWHRFVALCKRRGMSASQMLRRLLMMALSEAYDPLHDPPEEEVRDE